MQFEDFDKKAREAAEHHQAPFDEGAWSGMEKMLDKHMPVQDDDRRRVIFWLLLFLLIGGGLTWFFTDKVASGKKEKELATTSAKNRSTNTELRNNENTVSTTRTEAPIAVEPTNDLQPTAPVVLNNAVVETKKNLPMDNTKSSVEINKPASVSQVANNKTGTTKKTTTAVADKNILLNPVKQAASVIAENNDRKITQSKIENDVVATKPLATTPDNTSKPKVDSVKKVDAIPSLNVETIASAENKNQEKKKDKSGSKRSPFFFTLSAGADRSSVGATRSGDIKIFKGIGAGYTFRDRLTLRVGFYEARKIYTAVPADYKPGGTLPSNWRYLTKIDADCKVYEVPLSLSWNIIHSKKHNVFAGAGLSSYFMKKESYDYSYKYPNSPQPVVYNYTVNNENKHYFSVLGLSAGFQQHLTPAISISAEPYLKLPLTGIGVGNVRLKSAGIMVSAIIQPFKR
jgi:hypothetical protein